MANETIYSNLQTVAAYLDSQIAPAFRSKVVMPQLCHLVEFKQGSDSVKLIKAGTVTATAATEATDHATSNYAETSPATLQAREVKVFIEISDKAIYFGGANLAALKEECAVAIAQKVDQDSLALLDSLNGGTMIGTTGTAMTPAKILQGLYVLRANAVPAQGAVVLHPAGVYDVQSDILTAAASYWTNPTTLSIMNGQAPAQNGYVGSMFGAPILETVNTESKNAAADWAGGVVGMGLALAMGFFQGVKTEVNRNIKKGVLEIACSYWFDVEEYNDTAGVGLLHAV